MKELASLREQLPLTELIAFKQKLQTLINDTPQFVLILILIVAVILLFRKQIFKRKIPSQIEWKDEWPFYAKQLLSQPEQVLFHRLVNALPDCIILAQVQVSQVLGVHKGFNFYEWHNRINRLSYDFVICKKDGAVLAVIELDDKSHESSERIEADKRKDRATAAADIRMIRWHLKSMPDEIAIRDIFKPSPIFTDTLNKKIPLSLQHLRLSFDFPESAKFSLHYQPRFK